MATPHEQDLARLRGVLHLATTARTNHEILLQHRPLVDAIRLALALLGDPHPWDEPLRNSLLMVRLAVRRQATGARRWWIHDYGLLETALDRIDEMMGPFSDGDA